jgi:hypothetical protein
MLKVRFSNSGTALQKREALEAVRMLPKNAGHSRIIIRGFSELTWRKAKIGHILASFRSGSASSGSAKTLFGPCCEFAVSNQALRKGMHKAPTVEKGSDSDSTRSQATAQE